MDYILDPVVVLSTAATARNSSETLTEPKKVAANDGVKEGSNIKEGSGAKTPEEVAKLNKKTEEEFGKLENRIEETYNLVSKTTSGWGSSLTGFFSKVKIPEIGIEETQKKFEELRMNLPEVVAQRRKQVEEMASKGGKQLNDQFANISKSLNSQKEQVNMESNPVEDTKPKKMLDMLANATNSYLDDLDRELEQVEKFSLNYATKLSSFVKKNILESDAKIRENALEEANKGDLNDDEASVLFNVPENIKTPIYATRTEAQLHALHTSQDLYVTDAIDSEFYEFQKKFDLQKKTEEISSLLKKHSHLQNLMSVLVPTKVSYDEFWARYFFMHGRILEQEERRKQLLQQDNSADEDDFAWDDEDDDDELSNTKKSPSKTANSNDDDKLKVKPAAGNVESRTSSELTYDLKSTNSSTLDVVASIKSDKQAKHAGTNDDDDNDDDWK